ncbi:MAG: von willebrand factor type, partial [Alphaproteobacteria bacterium]|nr:von willebrand factor type [Alphaproteobacteria bacterium]
MSHIVGTVQTVSPAIHLGPDAGPPTDGPDTWTLKFQHVVAATGTKLLILHFSGASMPGNNRLEVDLGYGGADTMDVFTAANGADFWTRPVNVQAFADGKVPIRYIRDGGGPAGSVILDKYGRGERHPGDQDPNALSNCDPFLIDSHYVEPIYDPFWFCSQPPNWENIETVAAGDLRRDVAPSVGMIIHVDKSEFQNPQIDVLSTCSVTLIGPDLVITAGHCMAEPDEHARSSSVIFNYQTDKNGNRPGTYAPRFFKVKKVVAQHWTPNSDQIDYCLFQLDVPPGLPPIQMRHDVPGAGEQVFGLHHPNGAVKKLSIPHGQGFATVVSSDANNVRVPHSFSVSGGSSGSGLFDAAGRIVGVLADGDPCANASSFLRYYPAASILQQVANPPVPPPASRDVMIVFDRSGSMSLSGASGRPKIDEARDAASLFVQLVRTGTGNRVGLVSFSTGPHLDFSLHNATAANKQSLVGPAPFTGGIMAGLVADGATTIGGGLKTAAQQLPAGGANPRTIMLLTDGLQNTGPMVGDMSVQSAISGIDIDAIGYGADGDLDGNLLTSLAQAHNGRYARADSSLQLEKYFSQAFGNIFEAGLLADPEFVLAANQHRGEPFPFNVCGEERITIVVGWDNTDTTLMIEVHPPGGAVFTAGAAGTDSSTGRSWTFLKVPLPHGGERDGKWQVVAFRPGGGGEFPPPAPETRYFINVIASGGPTLRRVPAPARFYTGDSINPTVFLAYGSGGGSPDNAQVTVTVTRPTDAAGNLLAREGLKAPLAIGGDTIPARQATLRAIAARTGKPPVAYATQTWDLVGTPGGTGGAFEPDGLFGRPFDDLLTVEGEYTFHCVATYGEGCISSRELQWTVHVEPGVDPGRTGVDPHQTGTAPDGSAAGTIVITPSDQYGNLVGPGRGDGLTLTGGAGTTITGDPVDNGDGTYTVPAQWDPTSGPVLIVGQPDRPPVVVT